MNIFKRINFKILEWIIAKKDKKKFLKFLEKSKIKPDDLVSMSHLNRH